jgi:hypothetical protein
MNKYELAMKPEAEAVPSLPKRSTSAARPVSRKRGRALAPRHALLASLIGAAFLAGCASEGELGFESEEAAASDGQEALGENSQAISNGGQFADASMNFSHTTVSIWSRHELGNRYCTGTIVGARHVITAAHCAPKTGHLVRFYDGAHVRAPSESRVITRIYKRARVNPIENHPDWDLFRPSSWNWDSGMFDENGKWADLLVLELDREIPSYAWAADLPLSYIGNGAQSSAGYQVGSGLHNDAANDAALLKWRTSKVYSSDDNDGHMLVDSSDVNSGDSGGPYYTLTNGRLVVHGALTGTRFEWAARSKYTSVAKHVTWILHAMGVTAPQANVDRGGTPYAVLSSTSALDCALKCAQDARCKAYTYVGAWRQCLPTDGSGQARVDTTRSVASGFKDSTLVNVNCTSEFSNYCTLPDLRDVTMSIRRDMSPGNAANGWRIYGIGDFDGNGVTDLVWRRTNDVGEVRIWFLNNDGSVSRDVGLPAPDGFRVQGVGDFNGDGRDELVIRRANESGEAHILVVGPTGALTADLALPQGAPGWSLIGVGDFDGNRKSDLLWRRSNGTGELRIWSMDGGTLLSDSAVAQVVGEPYPRAYIWGTIQTSPEWKVYGVGDFDGDGRSDIVWRRTDDSREARIWTLDGDHLKADIGLAPADSGQRIMAVRDFNRDGKADLLWRAANETGAAHIWLLDGQGGRIADRALPVGGDGWQLLGAGQTGTQGDRLPTLYWRRAGDTGEPRLWILNPAP